MEVRNARIKFGTAAVVCCESCFGVNGCAKSRAGSGLDQLALCVLILVAACRIGGASIRILDGIFLFPEWKLIQFCFGCSCAWFHFLSG